MQKAPKLVVFSDLDGTLLDHDTYSWDAAQPALDALRDLDAPLVLASSKTAVEIAALQEALGIQGAPAIVENGAGLIMAGEGGTDTSAYTSIRAALDALPPDLRFQFEGFGDLDANGVAKLTGLSADDAAKAKQRAFSEPGLWHGDAAGKAAFLKELFAQGIFAREGGRFLTLSHGKTKADRMADVIARYTPRMTVALGDAPNDVEMLETADLGIVVHNPHRAALPLLRGEAEGRIRRTDLPGPAGWNAAILALLEELE